jgi:hypothetical protein
MTICHSCIYQSVSVKPYPIGALARGGQNQINVITHPTLDLSLCRLTWSSHLPNGLSSVLTFSIWHLNLLVLALGFSFFNFKCSILQCVTLKFLFNIVTCRPIAK